MGWVSLIEDAIRRFEEDFHLATKDMPSEPVQIPIEEWRSIAGLLARGEKILAEAAKHLELATDPTLDIAYQLKCSVEEANSLGHKVSEFQKTCLSLASSLRAREIELKELKLQLRDQKVENNQLTKKLEAAMKENPTGVYEQYMKGVAHKT